MTTRLFDTTSTRMENIAREEGYEAGYEDGHEAGFQVSRDVTLDEADTLIGEYGLAVNSLDSERMRVTCKALFKALTGRVEHPIHKCPKCNNILDSTNVCHWCKRK